MKIDRTIVIEDVDAQQCRYRITGFVKVKMFGIGHLVEKQVMGNSVDSLSLLAEVVERCYPHPNINPTLYLPYVNIFWDRSPCGEAGHGKQRGLPQPAGRGGGTGLP